MVAWASQSAGPITSILGKRFTSAGVQLATEFQVNVYTSANRGAPDLAIGSGSGFVVTWSAAHDGDSYGIFARRFNSVGSSLATEFRVNSYTVGNQRLSVIASDGDGDFVMVWEGPGGSDPDGVFGRRFNSSGNPLANEFRANNATAGNQKRPSIDMDSDGDFVVTWMSPDGSMYGIFAQRFTSAGAPTGPEFQVNTYETGNQWYPSVGLDADGDFVVAWEDYTQDGDGSGIFARRFDSAGTPRDGEFQVNSRAAGPQTGASLATDSDGDFAIAWIDQGDVFVRRFKASGIPTSNAIQANTHTEGDQSFATLEADSDGDFVVSWASGDDSGTRRVRAALRRSVDHRRRWRRPVPPAHRRSPHAPIRIRFQRRHAHHRRGRPWLHALRRAVDHDLSAEPGLGFGRHR